ncbi:MAG TPA: acetyl-CoA acetyltransferase [Acidimicrobiia bacterium]|nr:acetyl-CoA acetyltransferase [Acidimicrobiia bacterium]
MAAVDPRAPCLIGVGQRTWHPDEVGEAGAPEPLVMWEDVVRLAADDTGLGSAVLDRLDSLQIVYCQTWQYDDPPARLADELDIAPAHSYYSGIGGTTPQVLVNGAAEQILAGELDVALVCGAEALATQRRYKQRGERYPYRFKPEERRPFPWEAPFHPAEVAHEVFQAWLTFAIFDNARRGHLGVGLDEYRNDLGELFEPFTELAAANPNAWFRVARSADEIVTATPENRMVGYPYTKYMVSIMDVDMAAAVVLASHEAADALGVPPDRRVYLRGWCYATDPVYVAEHDEMWRSPAMEAAAAEALRVGGVGVDDVAHFDVYSCFGSSVNFARDALRLGIDDERLLTVTGGLPYHGGAGSDYMTHSIATMADVLRNDPGSYGLLSGVGMHMTKHVYGLYSTEPGVVGPPDREGVQAKLDAAGKRSIRDVYDGAGSVAAYSVVHGRDGGPEWGVVVCDLPDGDRAYGRVVDGDALSSIEREELVGRKVTLTPTEAETAAGKQTVNVATL